MTQYWSKKEKMKKRIFARIKKGTKGEEDEICFTMQWSKSFLDTSFFLQFRINIGVVIPIEEFWKKNRYRGIELIFQMQIPKIWLICKFFCSRWKRGPVTDSEDMLQTRDWAILQKNWPAIQFCPLDFTTCPHPEVMSGICPRHFQPRFLQQWNIVLKIRCSHHDQLLLFKHKCIKGLDEVFITNWKYPHFQNISVQLQSKTRYHGRWEVNGISINQIHAKIFISLDYETNRPNKTASYNSSILKGCVVGKIQQMISRKLVY